MALLRVKQLSFQNISVTTGEVLLYLVPALTRAVVRDVRIYNLSGVAAAGVNVLVRGSGGSPAISLFRKDLAVSELASLAGQIVLEAGQFINAYTPVANVSFLVSGAELPITP